MAGAAATVPDSDCLGHQTWRSNCWRMPMTTAAHIKKAAISMNLLLVRAPAWRDLNHGGEMRQRDSRLPGGR